MTNSNCERAAFHFALGRNAFKQKDFLDVAYADSIYYNVAMTARSYGTKRVPVFPVIFIILALSKTHVKRIGGGHKDLSHLDVHIPWGDEYKCQTLK